jgi:hypothetical protein
MRTAAATVLGAVIFAIVTACGSSSASTSLDAGCFRMSQAVGEFNTAADAISNGTVTDADTAKAWQSVRGKLDDAAAVITSGKVHDLAATASTALGQARVELLANGNDDTVAKDVSTARQAMTDAAPLCKGHGA